MFAGQDTSSTVTPYQARHAGQWAMKSRVAVLGLNLPTLAPGANPLFNDAYRNKDTSFGFRHHEYTYWPLDPPA